jgi:hypothetical protein
MRPGRARGRARRHDYTPGRFGLDADIVEAQFSGYLAALPSMVPPASG